MPKSAPEYRTARRVISILLFVCLLPSFALPQVSSGPSRRDDEEDVGEAILQNQMWGWIKGSEESLAKAKHPDEKAIAKEMNFQIFFVSVNGKDPTDDFVKRFRNIPRIVKKVSASKTMHWRNAVVDKRTGRRGVIFRVGTIRLLSKDAAQADGGYFCDGLCGIDETFSVQRKNGKWIVTSVQVNRIS